MNLTEGVQDQGTFLGMSLSSLLASWYMCLTIDNGRRNTVNVSQIKRLLPRFSFCDCTAMFTMGRYMLWIRSKLGKNMPFVDQNGVFNDSVLYAIRNHSDMLFLSMQLRRSGLTKAIRLNELLG